VGLTDPVIAVVVITTVVGDADTTAVVTEGEPSHLPASGLQPTPQKSEVLPQ
jgi:hypothetical protein